MNHKLLVSMFCSLLLTKGGRSQQASHSPGREIAKIQVVTGKRPVGGQTGVVERLRAAVQKLEADSQMRHAILSLYVADAKTGAVVFDRNGDAGLAPASCQKLFTSVATLDLLGPAYRYKTRLAYSGLVVNGVLKGTLIIIGSGDPTAGSWRYESTKDVLVLDRWRKAIERAGIRHVTGYIAADERGYGSQSVPDGWIWQDIGNYYGAGAWGMNWHENQYEMKLEAGEKAGDPVKILSTYPEGVFTGDKGPGSKNARSIARAINGNGGQINQDTVDGDRTNEPGGAGKTAGWINELKTAPAGTGDNAYIYSAPYGSRAFLRGTIPLQKDPFTISGSMPDPPGFVAHLLGKTIGVLTPPAPDEIPAEKMPGDKMPGDKMLAEKMPGDKAPTDLNRVVIDSFYSPPLDSINYWFLKKSINLYGEALVKTLAYERTGRGSTEDGVNIVRDFWSHRGIELSAIHITDGSGLSPGNRVTTNALVHVLLYAKTRPWYASFYQALPEINGMRMKSGAIGGSRSYSGYQTCTDGKEYVFSMIVNNYDGLPAEVVKKLFGVLKILRGY